jgi:hypothetical protein
MNLDQVRPMPGRNRNSLTNPASTVHTVPLTLYYLSALIALPTLSAAHRRSYAGPSQPHHRRPHSSLPWPSVPGAPRTQCSKRRFLSEPVATPVLDAELRLCDT